MEFLKERDMVAVEGGNCIAGVNAMFMTGGLFYATAVGGAAGFLAAAAIGCALGELASS